MADPIQTKSTETTLATQFKLAPAEAKIAMAKEVFNTDPIAFLGEAFKYTAYASVSPALIVPKEVVEMDDILTQQMISTYRLDIAPLVILTTRN